MVYVVFKFGVLDHFYVDVDLTNPERMRLWCKGNIGGRQGVGEEGRGDQVVNSGPERTTFGSFLQLLDRFHFKILIR